MQDTVVEVKVLRNLYPLSKGSEHNITKSSGKHYRYQTEEKGRYGYLLCRRQKKTMFDTQTGTKTITKRKKKKENKIHRREFPHHKERRVSTMI